MKYLFVITLCLSASIAYSAPQKYHAYANDDEMLMDLARPADDVHPSADFDRFYAAIEKRLQARGYSLCPESTGGGEGSPFSPRLENGDKVVDKGENPTVFRNTVCIVDKKNKTEKKIELIIQSSYTLGIVE